MIRKNRIHRSAAGGLPLLFVVLGIYLLRGVFGQPPHERDSGDERVFVAISGDVYHPGVYGFNRPPDIKTLVVQAGGLTGRSKKDLSSTNISYQSGAHIDIRNQGEQTRITVSEMSAFHKITLQIPISLNKETQQGLTAIPGIGPKISGFIVRERDRRKGFKSVDEILSVPGVGPALYKKIRPYLML